MNVFCFVTSAFGFDMLFRLLRGRISHITRGSAIQGQFSYSHAGLPFVFFCQKVKVMMSEAQRNLKAS